MGAKDAEMPDHVKLKEEVKKSPRIWRQFARMSIRWRVRSRPPAAISCTVPRTRQARRSAVSRTPSGAIP